MIVKNAYRLEGGRARQVTVTDARTKKEYDEAHIFVLSASRKRIS
jgi:hypothetical protein